MEQNKFVMNHENICRLSLIHISSNLILKTADLLGLREEGSDDDEADEIVAQPGGEVNFPDGLQDTSVPVSYTHLCSAAYHPGQTLRFYTFCNILYSLYTF